MAGLCQDVCTTAYFLLPVIIVAILQPTFATGDNLTAILTPTMSNDTDEKSNTYTVSPVVNKDEEKKLFLKELQAKLEKAKIRYLLLDRTCETLNEPTLKVRFVYTKAFVESSQSESKNCWVEMKNSGRVPENVWKPNGEIKVLIHGFVSRFWEDPDEMMNNQRIFEMGEEYGNHTNDLNVIAVDWTSLAASISYNVAVFSTSHVGLNVAEFLMKIHRRKNLTVEDWDKVHLIGFSLGAHVSGIAGYQLQLLSAVKLGRITGLDPAAPLFNGSNQTSPEDMSGFLDRGDAKFVDIIHCNMGTALTWKQAVLEGRYGTWVQAGHVDFYPNGGMEQTYYCSGIKTKLGCSHKTCLNYFINSIRKMDYVACRCDSWQQFENGKCSPCQQNGGERSLMGDRCDKSARGRYYLRIGNGSEPVLKAKRKRRKQIHVD